ncbi:CapA family protein [Neobacillus massiliamazoniensis]|uniref:Capsule synthesis protein CapA n=1 Tax=Neobacillus massiliamazoniensis TaxID=1499688 RepID=A0A0U1NZ35_9BACI|nr:CapA family protein [Neobacillus massiliamazoniensis]CRK83290.1 capsule synthesis protein CapA [Neobacillus massiliamazoniensis]
MKKRVIVPSVLLLMVCSVVAYVLYFQHQKSSIIEKVNDQVAKFNETKTAKAVNKEFTEKVTIGAIGDILIHESVYKDAFNGSKYNFDPMFGNVKGLLEKPDILTANQESIAGGTELGLSGYPSFNSPYEVLDALVHAGVDMVSTANNHSLDKGEKGIQSEIHYLDSIGLPYVGSFRNEQDQKTLRIIEKNGIKVAFLAYTFGTNGIKVPPGKDYLVNIIHQDKMKEEIGRARNQADVVVMSIHWGIEYQRLPNTDQKDLAQFLANQGVDIIFGSHPHVLEPMEWIKTNDGRKTLVVYSLGNFISGQTNDYKDIGGMATIDITKHVTAHGDSIELSNPTFYPTIVSNQNLRNFRVVPLEKAGTFGFQNAEAKYKEIQSFMNQWLR